MSNDGNATNTEVNSESDADDDVIELEEVIKPPPPVLEVIDVGDTENDNNVTVTSRQTSGNDLSSAGRPRRSTATPKEYKELSDDDDCVKEEKNRNLQKSIKFIHCLKMFLNEHPNAKLDSHVTHLKFGADQSIELEDFKRLFDANRRKITSVSLENTNSKLLKEIACRCEVLEVLAITDTNSGFNEDMEPIPAGIGTKRPYFFRPSLVSVSLAGTNDFLRNDQHLLDLLASLPKQLEELHYTFSTPQDATRILKALESCKNLNGLKILTLTSSKLKSVKNDELDPCLHREQIHLLKGLNLSLGTLELNCGIWEDVKAVDLASLLTKFASTLTNFVIAENLRGVDLADKQLKLQVPQLPRLISFSMGSVYEFKEDFDDEDDEDDYDDDDGDYRSRQASLLIGSAQQDKDIHIISLDKPELIAIEISFKPMPTLQSLSLGNLVHIESISPAMFPDLRKLHIASNWTLTLNIPTTPSHIEIVENTSSSSVQFPVFKWVRELQLPDFLQNEFFVLNIRKMFPVLQKVTMKFPSMKCVRYFFHAMANSPLHTLHLKTSCDFEGMLEDAMFPRRPHPLVAHDQNLVQLLELKNPKDGDKVFKDFVRDKAIELPIWAAPVDDEIINSRKYGMLDLSDLNTLVIGHLPRTLKVPLDNKLPHNHPTQKFHPTCTIGFRRYPLSKKFLKKDLKKLRNLEKFRHGDHFQIFGNYRLFNQVKFEGNNLSNYKDKNVHNFDNGSSDEDGGNFSDQAVFFNSDGNTARVKRKRKLAVSRVSIAGQQFKVKKESIDAKPDIKMKFEVKAEVKQETVKKELE